MTLNLFRGICKEKNKVIEGILFKNNLGTFLLSSNKHNIPKTVVEFKHDPCFWGFEISQVKPRSVEQYIGLRDKKGKKAFTGDICQDSNGNIFKIKYDTKKCKFYGEYLNDLFTVYIYPFDGSEFEIIRK